MDNKGEPNKKEYYTKEDLERLLDSMPFSAWIKSEDNRYIYVNEVYANTVGDVKENVIGRYDSDYWSEEACKCCHASDREVIESKMPKLFEEVRGEGIYKRWFETYKKAFFNQGNEVQYILGTSRGITLAKTLNEGMYENNRKFNLLNSSEEVQHKAKNNELIRTIEMDIFKWLDASGVAIWLYGEDDSRAQIYTKTGRNPGYIGNTNYLKIHKQDLNEELTGENIEGIKHIKERAKYVNIDAMVKKGIKYMGIYKIEHDGEILGVLTCSFSNDKKVKVNQDGLIKETCKKIANIIKFRSVSMQLKHRLESFESTKRELNLFLETVIDVSAIIGKDGSIIRVSEACIRLFGWSEQEFLLMKWSDVIHPDDFKKVQEVVLRNEQISITRGIKVRYKCKDGNYRWLEMDIRYLEESGVTLVAASDITSQVKMEEKSRELQKAIELETIKNEFFANISHEFKTPINIILGTIQLLNGKLNEYEKNLELTRYSKFIKQNAYRLLRLVNNLIDITRIDSGHYPIQMENHNIVSVVEEITLSVVSYMDNKDIELIFDTETEEQIIACDTDKIERIMLNLLSNAVKYTERGGKVEVYISVDKEYVYISVTDTGVGISEEKIGIIFERFVQVDNILTRQAEGSGIGLSLVKSLVEMHDGEIEVESELGAGTKITVKLPVRLTHSKSMISNYQEDGRIEKCNVEFSDIYW